MDRYEIIQELATGSRSFITRDVDLRDAGSTATVYKAFDIKCKEHVAIKRYKQSYTVAQSAYSVVC